VRGADAVERNSELKRQKRIRLAGVGHYIKRIRCVRRAPKRLP
jgi:hypothetical protein